jgi:hypothetical protein
MPGTMNPGVLEASSSKKRELKRVSSLDRNKNKARIFIAKNM